jgi:transcriptional regulator with XRE-family HTH domain
MQNLILEIRNRMNVSQDDLAKMIGISFATVNRWENGHSTPNKAAQLRLYDVCKEKGVDLETIIQKKIEDVVSGLKVRDGSLILYHGSKSGIKGPIAPISRDRCDFGRGFYMGTESYQPLTLISDFEQSKFYVVSLDLSDLRVLKVSPDIEWALLVAFNRGKMDEIRDTELYDHYARMARGYDVIVGSIANDRMFYVLDNFFLGNITDKALVMSLSALQLGQQYVAVTENACSHVVIEAEIELSHLERVFLRDLIEANRVKGVNLANDICRDYRREGLFFDEILKSAAEGKGENRG